MVFTTMTALEPAWLTSFMNSSVPNSESWASPPHAGLVSRSFLFPTPFVQS
ncbi:MAG: hypothetical protein GWN18_06975 [Thermoplasmata archaeon]|nr:hypothetical protein [Thermoplasmata archaeon]